MGKLFDELKQMKQAYDKKLRDDGEAAVKDAFKDLFEKFPEVKSVAWSQYTPYFNDGDACTFGVNEFDVNLQKTAESIRLEKEAIQKEIDDKKVAMKLAADSGDYRKAQSIRDQVDRLLGELDSAGDADDDDYNYGEGVYTLKKSKNPREVAIGTAIQALQSELPDDVPESVFGDHAKILATRDGFKVSEFQHD